MHLYSFIRPLFGALLLVLGIAASAAGLEVKTLDGTVSSLAAELKPGQHTVVMVWTTYCGVCKRDYPILSAFHDAHVGKDAEVLGISLDGYADLDKVRAFVAKRSFSFRTVVADAAVMAKGFEIATGEKFTGTPTYLVFNEKRELIGARSGDVSRDALETFLRKQTPQS